MALEKFTTNEKGQVPIHISAPLEFVGPLPPSRACGWCGQRASLNQALAYEYSAPGVAITVTGIPGYACDNCENITYTSAIADLIGERIDQKLEQMETPDPSS